MKNGRANRVHAQSLPGEMGPAGDHIMPVGETVSHALFVFRLFNDFCTDPPAGLQHAASLCVLTKLTTAQVQTQRQLPPIIRLAAWVTPTPVVVGEFVLLCFAVIIQTTGAIQFPRNHTTIVAARRGWYIGASCGVVDEERAPVPTPPPSGVATLLSTTTLIIPASPLFSFTCLKQAATSSSAFSSQTRGGPRSRCCGLAILDGYGTTVEKFHRT